MEWIGQGCLMMQVLMLWECFNRDKETSYYRQVVWEWVNCIFVRRYCKCYGVRQIQCFFLGDSVEHSGWFFYAEHYWLDEFLTGYRCIIISTSVCIERKESAGISIRLIGYNRHNIIKQHICSFIINSRQPGVVGNLCGSALLLHNGCCIIINNMCSIHVSQKN